MMDIRGSIGWARFGAFLALFALAGCATEVAAPSGFAEVTLAGRAEDGETFVAVIRNGTSFLAYACDDTRDAWFRGDSLASPMELSDSDGNRLFLALSEDDLSAVGEVAFGEEEPRPFALDATDEEVLFRAEGVMSGEPLLAGWIRLPDGEQRGLVRRATSTTTSRINDALRVVTPEQFTRLLPAPFTPPVLAAPTRARVEPFRLFALGDSYGAGEGAPEIPGDYESNGTLREGGRREVWDTSLDEAGEREARACHRSGISGIEMAAEILRAEYAGAVDVRLQSFACSGSQTEHFLTCDYRGAIGDHFSRATDFLPPQLRRLRDASRLVGADAVYMSIGGNDMRFGALIAACLGGDCGPGTSVEGEFNRATRTVGAKYEAIADVLELLLPSEHVYLAAAPNPVIDERGRPCAEIDLLDFAGVGVIGSEQVRWLAGEILPAMNQAMSDGADANGWTLVTAHLARFDQHGYCSREPWFLDNPSSLALQGRWMTDARDARSFPLDTCISPAETRETVGPLSPAVIAGGIVHPNAAGYAEGYAPGIAETMRAQLEAHVRPAAVAGLRVQVQANLGGVRLAWDERASTETEYRVRLRYTEAPAGTPTTDVMVLPRDSRTADLPLFGRTRGTAEVFGCYIGPAPTRREVCGQPRSVTFSNFAPTVRVAGVRVDTSQRAPLVPDRRLSPQRLVRVVWTPSAEQGVVYYDVQLEEAGGATRRLATTDAFLIASPQLVRAQVRACNYLGCTDASTSVSGPACAVSEIVGIDGRCAPGQSADLSPRDLACPGLVSDPAGICRR